ncbi:hypothetical protein DFS34DRAFT_693734 [Phlyctochytrium arcticum]|nr:hypothetical protein DFS34DRAFT_693734 [Phlyctochytrium arcticum]
MLYFYQENIVPASFVVSLVDQEGHPAKGNISEFQEDAGAPRLRESPGLNALASSLVDKSGAVLASLVPDVVQFLKSSKPNGTFARAFCPRLRACDGVLFVVKPVGTHFIIVSFWRLYLHEVSPPPPTPAPQHLSIRFTVPGHTGNLQRLPQTRISPDLAFPVAATTPPTFLPQSPRELLFPSVSLPEHHAPFPYLPREILFLSLLQALLSTQFPHL